MAALKQKGIKRKRPSTEHVGSSSKRLRLTQSVCCPICIVNLSILSEFEARGHILQCMEDYKAMKENENNENKNENNHIQQRRQQRIKHNQSVNEWKNIFDSKQNENKKKQKEKEQTHQIAAFERIKGTNIVMNKFNHSTNNESNFVHFLTHFRFDYYKKLESSFKFPIFCSKETANLCKTMLNLTESSLFSVNRNKKTLIPQSNPLTFVTLFDSNNYIKGSVALLFQITNQQNSQKNCQNLDKIITINGQKNMSMNHWLSHQKNTKSANEKSENYEIVYNDLYFSDFYCDDASMNEAMCKKLKSLKIRRLYLDSTYFEPKFEFIPRRKLFEKIKNLINDFLKECGKKNIYFLFGIQFIEKMDFLIFLSKAFGEKIRINKTKKRLLACLELRQDENECFVTKDGDAQLFEALDVNNVTFKNMNKRIKNEKNLDKMIGIKLVPPKNANSKIRKMTKEKVTIVTVPYADHCNFKQLTQFIQMTDPQTIIPTANFKQATKCIARYCK